MEERRRTAECVEWFGPASIGYGAAPAGLYVVHLANDIYSVGGVRQIFPTLPAQTFNITFFIGTHEVFGRDGTAEIVVGADVQPQSFSIVYHAATIRGPRDGRREPGIPPGAASPETDRARGPRKPTCAYESSVATSTISPIPSSRIPASIFSRSPTITITAASGWRWSRAATFAVAASIAAIARV